MVLLLKKIRNKRSENLILAVVLHKPQHNVISMQLKAVSVDLKPATIGRAAKFVNHPDNLPDIDFIPDQTDDAVKPGNRYSLRESIKPPNKLDL